MLFAIACLPLIGLDLYLSYRRMQTYGPVVELNPVARDLAENQGMSAGIIFLGLYNLAVLSVIVGLHADTLLHIFFGAKLGLAAMQLKSLQIEHFVEKLLKGIKK